MQIFKPQSKLQLLQVLSWFKNVFQFSYSFRLCSHKTPLINSLPFSHSSKVYLTIKYHPLSLIETQEDHQDNAADLTSKEADTFQL